MAGSHGCRQLACIHQPIAIRVGLFKRTHSVCRRVRRGGSLINGVHQPVAIHVSLLVGSTQLGQHRGVAVARRAGADRCTAHGRYRAALQAGKAGRSTQQRVACGSPQQTAGPPPRGSGRSQWPAGAGMCVWGGRRGGRGEGGASRHAHVRPLLLPHDPNCTNPHQQHSNKCTHPTHGTRTASVCPQLAGLAATQRLTPAMHLKPVLTASASSGSPPAGRRTRGASAARPHPCPQSAAGGATAAAPMFLC